MRRGSGTRATRRPRRAGGRSNSQTSTAASMSAPQSRPATPKSWQDPSRAASAPSSPATRPDGAHAATGRVVLRLLYGRALVALWAAHDARARRSCPAPTSSAGLTGCSRSAAHGARQARPPPRAPGAAPPAAGDRRPRRRPPRAHGCAPDTRCPRAPRADGFRDDEPDERGRPTTAGRQPRACERRPLPGRLVAHLSRASGPRGGAAGQRAASPPRRHFGV